MKKAAIYATGFLCLVIVAALSGLGVYAVAEQVVSNSLSVSGVVLSMPSPGGAGGGGGGGAMEYKGEANAFGKSGTFITDYKGLVLEDYSAASDDGLVSLVIGEGTRALGSDGKRLGSLEAVEVDDPPEPPSGKDIVGLPYDFGPDGATFNPPITLSWKFDSTVTAPEDLTIAYYDRASGQWIELPCTVDYATNTIVAEISHFTVFALIGKVEAPEVIVPTPPTPAPAPSPAPPTVVELEPQEPPTVTPEEPTPSAPPTTPAPLTPLPEKEGLGGGAIAAIIIGAAGVGILSIWFIRRRHSESE